MRKLMGVTLIAMVAALALPMLPAGAQAIPEPPGDCVILTVAPNPVPRFPFQVTIVGQAPQGVHIVLWANGVEASPNSPSDRVTDDVTQTTFQLKYTVNGPTDLTVNFEYGDGNAYTATCATPDGEVVVRVDAEATSVTVPAPAANAAALAFTGSSDAPSYVLIGIAAIVVGAVLVVAARRRSQVS